MLLFLSFRYSGSRHWSLLFSDLLNLCSGLLDGHFLLLRNLMWWSGNSQDHFKQFLKVSTSCILHWIYTGMLPFPKHGLYKTLGLCSLPLFSALPLFSLLCDKGSASGLAKLSYLVEGLSKLLDFGKKRTASKMNLNWESFFHYTDVIDLLVFPGIKYWMSLPSYHHLEFYCLTTACLFLKHPTVIHEFIIF